MSKIKLVVEIDKERYKSICNGVEKAKKVNVPSWYAHKIIANGIPLNELLEKIRAEIQEELKQDNHSFYRAALEDVIKIIDRYEGEQE